MLPLGKPFVYLFQTLLEIKNSKALLSVSNFKDDKGPHPCCVCSMDNGSHSRSSRKNNLKSDCRDVLVQVLAGPEGRIVPFFTPKTRKRHSLFGCLHFTAPMNDDDNNFTYIFLHTLVLVTTSLHYTVFIFLQSLLQPVSHPPSTVLSHSHI